MQMKKMTKFSMKIVAKISKRYFEIVVENTFADFISIKLSQFLHLHSIGIRVNETQISRQRQNQDGRRQKNSVFYKCMRSR